MRKPRQSNYHVNRNMNTTMSAPPTPALHVHVGSTGLVFSVADNIALNTLVGFTVGFLVALSTVYALFTRVWEAIKKSRCNPCRRRKRHRQTPQYGMPAVSDFLDDPRRISRYRVTLLFAAATLFMLEAINSVIHYYVLWQVGWADTFILNAVRLFTILPGAPLVVIATVLRISLLMVAQPASRQQFVRGMLIMTCVIQVIVFCTVAVCVWQQRELDIVQWQTAVIIPSWSAGLLAVLPLALIVMSMWSLKVAFNASDNSVGLDSMVSTNYKTRVGGTGHAATSAANEPSVNSTASSACSPRVLLNSTSHEQSKFPPAVGTRRPSAKVFVGRTFKLLTFMLSIYWVSFLVFIALYRPFPIYSTAITTTLCALATATEAAFDWLINYNRGVGPTADEDDAAGPSGLSRRVSLREKIEHKILATKRTSFLSAGGGPGGGGAKGQRKVKVVGGEPSQQHSGGHIISGGPSM